VFVRLLDEDEDVPEKRLKALRVVKEFLEEEGNNRFNTAVFLNPASFDLNPPPPAEHPKIDHFLQYLDIVKIIKETFNNVDGTWAANNMEDAMFYFTEGHIPFAAHADLGFPLEHVLPADYTHFGIQGNNGSSL
jgi:hypothetical protein